MKSREIRQSFVDYFAARGHRLYPSAPLVPHGDATLLFTNAGMVQFKDFFTGAAVPETRRAVTVQKCLRVSGKHNDLENVGPSPRHHTFFEMLGNFSFGDYFKEEAIGFGWQLVTGVWGLSPAHLFASVFEQDDEAFELWRRISGLPAERIVRCGEKDNFWAMGETGPCGPCSEIYVDRHPGRPAVSWDEGTESGRYLEIWNLVFMQYERDASGAMTPLPKPSIDTGAGLERVVAVLAGVDSNYDTDLFRPILEAAATLAGKAYGRDAGDDVSMRVIADHLRAVAFLLADGVIPSNEGRGYVLRRLLRRAVRHGMRLGFEEPFMNRLVPVVDEAMAGFYPELAATRGASVATVRAEEEKFLATVAAGAAKVQEAIEAAKERGERRLDGETLFRLYDTYGLPVDVAREVAEEEKFGLDEAGFATALETQRERSRTAISGSQDRMKKIKELTTGAQGWGGLPATKFVGYLEGVDDRGQKLSTREKGPQRVVRVKSGGDLALAGDGASSPAKGEEGIVVVETTPFYAESGGQVGDRGTITWDGGRAEVSDTQKDGSGTIYHFVTISEGVLSPNQQLFLSVDPAHRLPTQRNHTATHLLQAALRKVLGEGVRQAGSLVHPDHLRFDFTHAHALTADERRQVEDLVNGWVLAAIPTRIVADRPIAEALASGAMALFGEKYGDRVRTVEVPGVSLELCGGCHVRNTGEIGPFLILSERAVASGVRRIEALTGERALATLRDRDALLARLEGRLGSAGERAAEAVEALHGKVKELERELARVRLQMVSGAGSAAADEATVEGIRVVAREVPSVPAGELRGMADSLRGKLGSGVVVLGTRGEGKVSLIAAVSPDLVGRIPAGKLLREVAQVVGGAGGGRDDFAQAGGKHPERLPEALARVPEVVRSLASSG
jgi:alanyl-tRNA synthetase